MLANEKERTHGVYSQVSATLDDQEVQELWQRLRSELTRKGGGPDICLEYLESELTRMEEQIRRAVDWLYAGMEE